MEVRNQGPVICRQCKKDIKTEVHKCIPCDKLFHPSCVKLHKIYNTENELIPCKGKTEIFLIKPSANEGVVAGGSSRERKASTSEGCRITGRSMDSRIEEIYIMIKEIKDDMVGKNLIKKAITEAVDEEMDRVRQEIQNWKETELETLISSTFKREMHSLAQLLPTMGTNIQETGKKKSYSEAASNKKEAVIIIKPIEENDACSSEQTKRDIKNNIDVAKLGVGITRMKKVTRGAVVIGCENKNQAEILKKKVTSDMGEKYTIQAPKKKKLKIKIFDVDKEDCEKEQEFWERIEEQNGFMKNSVQGKIVHKSVIGKSQRMTIIAEVDTKTHDMMLDEGKVKIGWNICKVQVYIGILYRDTKVF